MFCSRLPSSVVVAQTVLEIFDGDFFGKFPNFLTISIFDFPQIVYNVWEGVTNETRSMNDIYQAVFEKNRLSYSAIMLSTDGNLRL